MGIFKKSIVGMEIDTAEIRAVSLQKTSGKIHLISCGRMPLRKGILKGGKVLQPNLLCEAILKLWDENNIKCRDVILGINNQDIIVRFATFPKVPEDKIDSLIRFQSEDYIPIPLEEIELDYAVLGEDASTVPAQLRILLVAARKKMLFDFINAMQSARLDVIDIGVSMLSLKRLIPKSLQGAPLAVVNLSNDIGSIVITDGKKPGLARTFSYNTDINKAVSKYLNNNTSPEYVMEEKELTTVCDYIAGEIRSSVLYYQNQYPYTNVLNLAITGGISRTKGFVQRLKETLGIDVLLFGLLETIDVNNSESDVNLFNAPDFAVCTSLALRGLEV